MTEAYIVSAFLDVMEREDMKSKPKHMPVMSLLTDEEKSRWLCSDSGELVNKLDILCVDSVIQLRHDLGLSATRGHES